MSRLPGFLDSITRSGEVGLAIYTAGTDVLAVDDLGMLMLTAEDVLARDVFVVDQLRLRNVPVVMLLGGGYTSESHRLIAISVAAILNRHCRSESTQFENG
jgi:histone deacetylase 11